MEYHSVIIRNEASEMAPRAKALAANSDDLSFTPRTCVVEGQN